jgi:hypothetical protein
VRISVNRDDPGYENFVSWQRARVFLDGVERNGVVTADEEARLIVMVARDEAGDVRLNKEGTEVLYETLYGHVRVERIG